MAHTGFTHGLGTFPIPIPELWAQVWEARVLGWELCVGALTPEEPRARSCPFLAFRDMGCLLGKKVVCANKNPAALLIYGLFMYICGGELLSSACALSEKGEPSAWQCPSRDGAIVCRHREHL